MGTIAVDVDGVSKRFRLYNEKHQSLKERLVHLGRSSYEDFWALRDIAFEVAEGETVGILGRNGSGKSTLLKCVSGILQPTAGEVRVRGQLAALLELGAGFQPELSGRENIFLNASLLGLSTREVERRFDDIVAFAELEEHIDQQVKFYSSGMYVRLGFAVAVNVEPDVLVVDEVLAVGDEAFQRKCLARIKEFQDEGRTILFVTHAADLVRAICDRAVVLDRGRMLGIEPAAEAIGLYRQALIDAGAAQPAGAPPVVAQRIEVAPPAASAPIAVTAIELDHEGRGVRDHIVPGDPLRVRVLFRATEAVEGAVFAIELHEASSGVLVYASDTGIMGKHFDALPGEGIADFFFEGMPLLGGTYTVTVGIRSRTGGTVYDWHDQAARFEVVNPTPVTGMVALALHAEVRGAVSG